MGGHIEACTFDFCLSTSIPVLTTNIDEVAWPQGAQIFGGGLVTQGQGRTSGRGVGHGSRRKGTGLWFWLQGQAGN